MSMDTDTTATLIAATKGDVAAQKLLTEAVYDQLRAMAGKMMKAERANHTLHATALVHEAYLRMIDQRRVDRNCEKHVLAIYARMMRRVLIDHGRAQKAAKRGGGAAKVAVDDAQIGGKTDRLDDDMALAEALEELEQLNERQARVVELRYFGGLSVKETADELGVSERTVKDDWRMSKAWLGVRLSR